MSFSIESLYNNCIVENMLLRDDLKYVVLDFETTGIDKKYDEIIQVWIVEFDIAWNVLREFSSYVQPTRTEKIHDIVDMITWISMDTLLGAPSWESIFDTVASFFDEKTVIIWHSIWFDIAFLKRYWVHTFYTSIDTLPLAQTLKPYMPSYALEIIAQAITKNNGKKSYHDALIDSQITWAVFFALMKDLWAIFYEFPYLREITKRTPEWLPQCIAQKKDERYLIKDIPVLNTHIAQQKTWNGETPIAPWTRYAWNNALENIAQITTKWNYISWFAHHQKVLLTQKKLAQQGTMLHIHEQHIFDDTLLHHFFTKKLFTEREWRFAIKYHVHVFHKHKSLHATSWFDYMLLKALRWSTTLAPTKKLFTHAEIFSHIDSLSLSPETQIVLFDKEWLFDSWKKRRFQPIDLYVFAQICESIQYKYELENRNDIYIKQILHTWYIFTWIFTHEIMSYIRDINKENATIDNYTWSTYFTKSNKILAHLDQLIKDMAPYIEAFDCVAIEKSYHQITTLLLSPFSAQMKRSDYNQWVVIQPIDTYASWDDITQMMTWYNVTILSVLDTKFPPLALPQDTLSSKPIVKRKDIVVWNIPKICIIAPSKAAAQQLIMSLHKSNAYKDCFLAGEHITWWAWKIIQQTLQKKSYILIGWYWFCLQCIAHGIEFDTISALDIQQNWNINPFMDISYYAAHTKKNP